MPIHPAAGAPGAAPAQPAPPAQPAAPGQHGYAPVPHRDRGAEAAEFARRHLRTPETKEFFKTSEFGVWAFTVVLLAIAGASSDSFGGGRLWIAVTVASAAYIVSRGIAKAGTSRGEPERHWGHEHDA